MTFKRSISTENLIIEIDQISSEDQSIDIIYLTRERIFAIDIQLWKLTANSQLYILKMECNLAVLLCAKFELDCNKSI